MTKPTIHSNGDRAETLVENYQKAARALQAALEALAETHPNARNFYPQGEEAIRASRAEHSARLDALNAIQRRHGRALSSLP